MQNCCSWTGAADLQQQIIPWIWITSSACPWWCMPSSLSPAKDAAGPQLLCTALFWLCLQFVFALDGQPIGSTSSSNSLFRRMSSANGINRKERLERLKLRIQQLWSPQRILLRDKLAFLLGSCLVW
jgi:hypothetical protein